MVKTIKHYSVLNFRRFDYFIILRDRFAVKKFPDLACSDSFVTVPFPFSTIPFHSRSVPIPFRFHFSLRYLPPYGALLHHLAPQKNVSNCDAICGANNIDGNFFNDPVTFKLFSNYLVCLKLILKINFKDKKPFCRINNWRINR